MRDAGKYPVKSRVRPGEIFAMIPDQPPEKPESFGEFMHDFEEIIMPGITHWQNPNFFAYFPANSSPPSVLAEMITATLGAQCMKCETLLCNRTGRKNDDLAQGPDWASPVLRGFYQTAINSPCSIITAREKA